MGGEGIEIAERIIKSLTQGPDRFPPRIRPLGQNYIEYKVLEEGGAECGC
jgi:hypothetical protein